MEARKITVVQTKGTNKTVIMSGAETLGQLKSDLRENRVDFTDMVFYEGVSRTELIDDNSILPSNLPFKGQVTNELVIMLTLKNKKIKSGAMTRSEAYAAVKDGNFQDAIKTKFGKNFTQVSTDELEKFVNSQKTGSSKPAPTTAAPKAEPVAKKPSHPAASLEAKKEEVKTACCDSNLKKALLLIVDILEEESVISDEQKEEILGIINESSEVSGTTAEAPAPKAPAKPKLESEG